MCVCAHVHACVCAVCVCVYVCVHLCVCCMWMCVCVCACVRACVHVWMCVCVFYFLFFANTSDGSSSSTSTIQGLYLDHVTNASLLSMWRPYFWAKKQLWSGISACQYLLPSFLPLPSVSPPFPFCPCFTNFSRNGTWGIDANTLVFFFSWLKTSVSCPSSVAGPRATSGNGVLAAAFQWHT